MRSEFFALGLHVSDVTMIMYMAKSEQQHCGFGCCPIPKLVILICRTRFEARAPKGVSEIVPLKAYQYL